MSYSFEEHKHRFAVWTAARAVQRSFTKTRIISDVIAETGLRSTSNTMENFSQNEFDEFHRTCCNDLAARFKQRDIDCSYGRAAKIVSIYLKTKLIIGGDLGGPLASIIHPPIDSILLKNLAKQDKYPGLGELAGRTWTNFDHTEYWSLVDLIRLNIGFFDWRLEEFWLPEQEYWVKKVAQEE